MQTLRTFFFSLFSLCLLCPQTFAQGQAAPAAAERATVVASAAGDRVRFAAPNRVARLRLEVLSASGDVLFETNSRGSVLDWTLADSQGNRLADGSYLCVVTVKDVAGRMTQRLTLVDIAGGVASARAAVAADLTPRQAEAVGPVEAEAGTQAAEAEAPAATLLAHDGTEGQLVTTAGDLSFRGGDFFTGKDKELMRLSADGSLEVTGALLARGGIRFSDGTVLSSAGNLGRAGAGKGAKSAAAGGGDAAAPSAAGSGTLNRLAKWAETGGAGTLTDSSLSEANGDVVVEGSNLRLSTPPTTQRETNLLYTSGANQTIGVLAAPVPSFGAANGPFFAMRGNQFTTISGQRGLFAIAAGQVPSPVGNEGSVIFQTGGDVARMIVRPDGNVGVGTTTPAQRLDVVGNVRVNGAGNGFIFPDGSKMTTAAAGGAGTAGTVPLWTGATTLGNSVIVQSGGNVGIGTSAPASKLQVVGGADGGVTASSTGAFALFGSNPSGWAVGAEGNARQSRDRGGFVKAMIYVDRTGAITRCFNSFEPDGGASLAGCGFTVSHPGTGVYTVGFPFAVNDRFYSLAAQAASTTESPRLNTGANFEFDVNPNSLVVSTFLADAAGNQTSDASFMLVVY